jgi:hypothetical protein
MEPRYKIIKRERRTSDVPCGEHAKGIQHIYQFHVTLLGAFKPLIQACLSRRRHHLPYALLLHHASVPHKLLHRTGWNWCDSNKDLSADELLKCLRASSRCRLMKRNTRVAHRHQHLLAAAHHADTAAPNLDWCRL